MPMKGLLPKKPLDIGFASKEKNNLKSECQKQQPQAHWHKRQGKHFASQLQIIPVQYGNKLLM